MENKNKQQEAANEWYENLSQEEKCNRWLSPPNSSEIMHQYLSEHPDQAEERKMICRSCLKDKCVCVAQAEKTIDELRNLHKEGKVVFANDFEAEKTYTVEEAVDHLKNGGAIDGDVTNTNLLNDILSRAFPKDNSVVGSPRKFYEESYYDAEYWDSSNNTNKPTIKLSSITPSSDGEEKTCRFVGDCDLNCITVCHNKAKNDLFEGEGKEESYQEVLRLVDFELLRAMEIFKAMSGNDTLKNEVRKVCKERYKSIASVQRKLWAYLPNPTPTK